MNAVPSVCFSLNSFLFFILLKAYQRTITQYCFNLKKKKKNFGGGGGRVKPVNLHETLNLFENLLSLLKVYRFFDDR